MEASLSGSLEAMSPGTEDASRRTGSPLPMIVLFFLGQRHFVQGIATTGSKG